jgi:hypothetical protein
MLLSLLLFPLLCTGSENLGEPLTRDGVGALTGYEGTVYRAVKFVPVCGTLAAANTKSFDITPTCSAAMNSYNRTTDTYAFYDLSGVIITYLPATGMEGCLCFSLGMISGAMGDLCIWISGYGQPNTEYDHIPQQDTFNRYGFFVFGSFQPGGKALPQCKDVDVASISASVYATSPTSIGNGTASGANNSRPMFPTQTASASGSNSTSSSPSSSSGLNVGTIVSIVIIVIIVLLIIAAIAACKKSRDSEVWAWVRVRVR